ncbi:cytosolic thiouridylase subunit Ctu2 [Schizosaccharomyces cryophilus OY26]|uniref:Cytoplasmic tRNA 2-thiolation protein 2 n=1 Tax=Schizosaccharomyces cryophilus (strain OY26 / ATCC MYA-4695 / CBS 11777 / NBRC 106824 / NRRL Y48691) TaxID=653667 RepID=S9XEH2_SCHCR|nr:cytosolic thiouridylase subunit Ctu2 [Schizosaccharomyces cryophilus OY26]EPY52191.1 cytosolic thiouridylase subunit Ctu2 [Schizosaccharomyces cryophilus OY26]
MQNMDGNDNDKVFLCRKCKKQATVMSRSEYSCDGCFVRSTENKIRRQFELLRPNLEHRRSRKALLAVSGGISSMAMLETAYYLSRYRKDNYRPMFDELLVVHLQSGSLQDEEGRAKTKVIIQKAIESYYTQCEFQVIQEDDLLKNAYCIDANGKLSHDDSSNCNSFNLEAIPSLASRQDLLYRVREQVLISIAEKEGCDTIVFGDCGTTIAARVLELVAEGRGFAIPWCTSVYSKLPDFPVSLLRPLREVLSSELKSYMKIKELDYIPTVVEERPATISGVAENYFKNLNDPFPSLVNTVVRMSSKLNVPEANKTCSLCKLPMQENAGAWLQKTTVQHPSEGQEDAVANPDICYACSVSLKNMKQPLRIPAVNKEE